MNQTVRALAETRGPKVKGTLYVIMKALREEAKEA